MRVARVNPPKDNMRMYSHSVNQGSQLNDEQLSAAQRFDDLLTAAEIQSPLDPGRIRAMAIIVSNAYRRALSTTAGFGRTEAWKTFIVATDRLAEALPYQSSPGCELRCIVAENSDLLSTAAERR
jgi:hypothetical protein